MVRGKRYPNLFSTRLKIVSARLTIHLCLLLLSEEDRTAIKQPSTRAACILCPGLYISVSQFSIFGLALALILGKSVILRLGPFIAAQRRITSREEGIVICRKAIDRDQLFARLDDIKSRTKSSIEISRRLIDQSFLRFKATHRNLNAAQRAQDLLNGSPQIKESVPASRERSALVRNWEHPEVLHSAGVEPNSRCDHCEGILLNKKAYRVRTHDQGLILLDMIVCYACNLEAKNLGLETEDLQATDDEPELTGNDPMSAVASSV